MMIFIQTASGYIISVCDGMSVLPVDQNFRHFRFVKNGLFRFSLGSGHLNVELKKIVKIRTKTKTNSCRVCPGLVRIWKMQSSP